MELPFFRIGTVLCNGVANYDSALEEDAIEKNPTGIYPTSGNKQQLVAHRAIINGVQCIAIMKGDKLLSYIAFDEFWKQANDGTFLTISPADQQLDSPTYCVNQQKKFKRIQTNSNYL